MKNRLLFLLLVCGVSLCAVPPLKNPAWLASATKTGGAPFAPTAAGGFIDNSAFIYKATAMDASDGKTFTVSFWVKPDAGYAAVRIITAFADFPVFQVDRTSGVIDIYATDSSGNPVLQTALAPAADSIWTHFLISMDLSDPDKRHCYTNGVLVPTNAITWTTYSNANINWSRPSYNASVGAANAGGFYFPGCISEPWFAISYLDLSVQANREFFIKAGQPQDPSGCGITPKFYFHDVYSNWGHNSGSLGDFTVQNSLNTCTAPP